MFFFPLVETCQIFFFYYAIRFHTLVQEMMIKICPSSGSAIQIVQVLWENDWSFNCKQINVQIVAFLFDSVFLDTS